MRIRMSVILQWVVFLVAFRAVRAFGSSGRILFVKKLKRLIFSSDDRIYLSVPLCVSKIVPY